MAEVPREVRRGVGVAIHAGELECGRDVVLGDHVSIQAERVVLGDAVAIEDGVQIRAKYVQLDAGARVERGCTVSALGGPARHVHIGEQSLVGHDTKVLVPVLLLGDYVAIQNRVLINGLRPVVVCHNSWVGQNCILNANERLTIGNHVGIGPYSSVYTHGFFGDLLEGCQVHKVAPVTLGDDVWIVGSYNVISPGVTLGSKALVLTGSTVTRDVPPNHCVGGAPARDLTAQFTPFRTLSVDEKLEKMRVFLQEYVTQQRAPWHETPDGYVVEASFGRYRIVLRRHLAQASELPEDRPMLVFAAESSLDAIPEQVTVFDLVRRTYTRRRTAAEIAAIRWLKNPRARFVPTDRPRVELPPHLEDA